MNNVIKKIQDYIFSIKLPEHWAEEGALPPNIESKRKAFEICECLFKTYSLVPDRIASTIEEGVFIAYDSTSISKTLYIEVYNNSEVGFLINDNFKKVIIYSKEILDFNNVKSFNFKHAIKLLNE